jgi:positive regulator of sigma E activity
VIYGTPLLGMVLSGLLASAAAAPEWLVAITAIAGFCAGFVMATYIVSRFRQTDLVPQIEDIHMNSGKQSRS